LFSSIGARTDGARALDLYCGSGAYGLEALSRGAATCIGVDRDARAIAAARANAAAAGFDDRAVFVRRDVATFLRAESRRRGPFGLVFCDPPYGTDGIERLFAPLRSCLVGGALVVVEERWTAGVPDDAPGYVLEADRRYGDTRVLTYRFEGAR
jgi:16S rRNA (guanine966-N2)-methyltransferase